MSNLLKYVFLFLIIIFSAILVYLGYLYFSKAKIIKQALPIMQILTGQVLSGDNIRVQTNRYCSDQFYLALGDRAVWLQMKNVQSEKESFNTLSRFENLNVEVKGSKDDKGKSCFTEVGVWCGCDYMDVDDIKVMK